MYLLLFIIHICISIALIVVFFLQSSGSSGSMRLFGGDDQLISSSVEDSFLHRMSIILVSSFFLTTLLLCMLQSRKSGESMFDRFNNLLSNTATATDNVRKIEDEKIDVSTNTFLNVSDVKKKELGVVDDALQKSQNIKIFDQQEDLKINASDTEEGLGTSVPVIIKEQEASDANKVVPSSSNSEENIE